MTLERAMEVQRDNTFFRNSAYETKTEDDKRLIVCFPYEESFLCGICGQGPFTMTAISSHLKKHVTDVISGTTVTRTYGEEVSIDFVLLHLFVFIHSTHVCLQGGGAPVSIALGTLLCT